MIRICSQRLPRHPLARATRALSQNVSKVSTTSTSDMVDSNHINSNAVIIEDDLPTPSMRVRGPSRRLVAPYQLRQVYPQQNGPALFAMRARLGLNQLNLDLLRDICSWKSDNRESLESTGTQQLDQHIRNHFRQMYPNMPELVIERVRNTLTESSVLKSVANDFGVEHAIIEAGMEPLYPNIVRAIIGAATEFNQAERLVKHHFLLRPIDWNSLLDFDYPDRAVDEMVKEYYNTTPVTRLLSEGGRQSPMPIFVVGLFAGLHKIGEGFGQSMSMAQHRARMDALRKHYLAKQPRQKIDASFKQNGYV